MQKAIIYICLAPAKLPVHSLKYCSFLLSAPKIKTVRSPLNLLFPGNLRSFVKSKKKSWRNGSFNLLARQWTWMISINSLSMVCVVYWSVWWLSSSFLVNGLWGGYVSLMIHLVDELKGVPKFQVGCVVPGRNNLDHRNYNRNYSKWTRNYSKWVGPYPRF